MVLKDHDYICKQDFDYWDYMIDTTLEPMKRRGQMNLEEMSKDFPVREVQCCKCGIALGSYNIAPSVNVVCALCISEPLRMLPIEEGPYGAQAASETSPSGAL